MSQAIKDSVACQYTYGHYTHGGLCKVIDALINPYHAIGQPWDSSAIDASYSIKPSSVFLDIGSGYGFPCFMVAAAVGC